MYVMPQSIEAKSTDHPILEAQRCWVLAGLIWTCFDIIAPHINDKQSLSYCQWEEQDVVLIIL